MKKIWNSLYWRISATLLIIFILLGLVYVVIAVNSSKQYFAETTQKLNADVAEHLLQEVNPFVDEKVNEDALGVIMHSMMAVNPGIEVYLLDPQGEILSFVVLDKKVKLNFIDIEPVTRFINSGGAEYILGDNPRIPERKSIFSATKIVIDGNHLGYVYMVLVSEQYDTITGSLQNSFILNLATKSFIITLLASFAIGLLAIWFLTKNLRIIIRTVRLFEEGDLNARIQISSKSELGQLAKTFNGMAETLLHNIDSLKQVDVLRRDLIANISHDLRTPLAVIHGYMETLMMKDAQLDTQKRTDYMNIVLQNTEKLKFRVDDLFELSKLEAKQVELNVEPFSLNELIQDISGKYALKSKESDITFDWDVSRSISMVEGDLGLIERVLQNLIDNAFKHTPKGGVIRIGILEKGLNVEVTVNNSGSYIESRDIPQLFSRYYKGDKSMDEESTGLGLAIVKNIIDLHNSIISVVSTKDTGTSFKFVLPIYSVS